MTGLLNPSAKLLCTALGRETAVRRVSILNQASVPDWEDCLALAMAQGLSPMLYSRLKSLADLVVIPTEVERPLREQYHINAMKSMQRRQILAKMLSSLKKESVPTIVLKGAFLADCVYEDASMRSMADVDLMIRQEDLGKASSILSELGYQVQKMAWGAKHLTLLAGNGRFPLELHWHILNRADPFQIDAADLWERAVPVTICVQPVLSLLPEDLLLHLSLHASFGHGFRVGLRSLCDIDAALLAFQKKLDWELLVKRAQAWQADRAVYLTLVLTNYLLKTAVPETALLAMKPEDWQEDYLETALRNLFDRAGGPYVSTNFARMWREKRPLQKAKIMWRSAVLDAEVKGINIESNLGNKQVDGGEGRNGRFRRYGDTAWRLIRNDLAIKQEIDLKNWLAS